MFLLLCQGVVSRRACRVEQGWVVRWAQDRRGGGRRSHLVDEAIALLGLESFVALEARHREDLMRVEGGRRKVEVRRRGRLGLARVARKSGLRASARAAQPPRASWHGAFGWGAPPIPTIGRFFKMFWLSPNPTHRLSSTSINSFVRKQANEQVRLRITLL